MSNIRRVGSTHLLPTFKNALCTGGLFAIFQYIVWHIPSNNMYVPIYASIFLSGLGTLTMQSVLG